MNDLKQEARDEHILCGGKGYMERKGGSDPCPRCFRESALIDKARAQERKKCLNKLKDLLEEEAM